MKHPVLLAIVLLVALFSAITLYQYKNEDLSAIMAARQTSEAMLLNSDLGATRYKVFGEDNIPTIILVHSFNGFLESWDRNIDALVDAGYRVVSYDLFGRGLSDRPWVDYDLALFRDQLDSIIQLTGASKVHLAGTSFGCVIASDFALHQPEKVLSLSLIGPAGWPSAEGRSTVLDTPIIGDLIFHYFGKQLIRPTVDGYFIDLDKHANEIAQWDRFASYPGFTRAALSILRYSPVTDYTAGWKELGQLDKPILFIWGKEDVSFPFSNTEKLPLLIPDAKIIGIDDAAHWVNIEKAAQVNRAIISFLNSIDRP
ncbi:MAG: alpha/beta hydrolase [Pseudomonadales bacterium]|nr:alpha/beta hydrolase [Pseudomonadales bacterium]